MTFKKGENMGADNYMWKGGIVMRKGRWWKRVPGHPRANKYSPYVKIAVLNMEKKIGRYLKPNEIVHHKNENKTDDRIKNLLLLQSNKEHKKLHRQFKTLEEQRNHKNEYQREWRRKNPEKVKMYKFKGRI